jgi:hypothetical protein
MLTAPPAALGGEDALICVPLATLAFPANWEPNRTCAVAGKFWPTRTVDVPPAFGPSEGCAIGAAAKTGAAPESEMGVAASTKLRPRLAMPKRRFVESASSISERLPASHKSETCPRMLRLWPSRAVMTGGAPVFSLTYKDSPSRENTIPFTTDVA